MKWAAIRVFVMLFFIFPQGGVLEAVASPLISLSSDTLPQGGSALIRIKVTEGEVPHVTWMNKEVSLLPNHQRTDWVGFIGADLTVRPGNYRLIVKEFPSRHETPLNIRVHEKDYGTRQLTLPKNMVDLDSKALKRVLKELEIMRKLFGTLLPDPIWAGPFMRPVSGDVVGTFGRRSIINNQPRAPHSGVDLKAERGTLIRSINNGRVVMTADHFFSGYSIIIDHGGGIQSMYFHLEKILVKRDQVVKKGEVVGMVGSTGRATGPHLHWGIRVNGARVDPLQFNDLSQELEE
ncbi:MAG: M23 family metallopeptidase [Pseudomonadota bacterium]